jgi:hypothetical protein
VFTEFEPTPHVGAPTQVAVLGVVVSYLHDRRTYPRAIV